MQITVLDSQLSDEIPIMAGYSVVDYVQRRLTCVGVDQAMEKEAKGEKMKTISSKGSTENSTMPTRRYTGSCRSARLQVLCNYSCWPDFIKVHCII